MASIFQNAAGSLNASPTRAMRQESSTESDSTLVPSYENGDETYPEVEYPKLLSTMGSPSPRKAGSNPLIATPSNRLSHCLSPKLQGLFEEPAPQSAETVKPQMRYKALGRPGPLQYTRNDSAISGDQGEGKSATSSDTSSTSSASWTGDSQFFRRIVPERLASPIREPDCAVSSWLERLPIDFRKSPESEEEPLEPLSPSVELGRGSMRRKQREWERKERGEEFDDADSFV
jgi:hypothetical protein